MSRSAGRLLHLGALLAAAAVGAAPATAEKQVPVTVDSFPRAESDLCMGRTVKEGGFGKFHHFRALTPIEHQSFIRMNRDTLTVRLYRPRAEILDGSWSFPEFQPVH